MLRLYKRHYYALCAVFELAKRYGKGPIKASDIASTQQIPARFLEVILGHLRGSGMVASKRGFYGGYLLALEPGKITVGDVFRFMHKQDGRNRSTDLFGLPETVVDGCCHGALEILWSKIQAAVSEIYDGTTIQDLLDNETLRMESRTQEQLCPVDRPGD